MPLVKFGSNTGCDYGGIEDASLYATGPTNNYGAGGDFNLQSGTWNSILRFTLLGNIPNTATINSAVLKWKWKQSYGASRTVSVYKLLVSTDEAQATWNERLTGTAWNTAGGMGSGTDRSATLSATGTGDGDIGDIIDVSGAQFTADVQAAVTAGTVLEMIATADGFVQFYSDEAASDGDRPELWVDYTLPGGGGGGRNKQAMHLLGVL